MPLDEDYERIDDDFHLMMQIFPEPDEGKGIPGITLRWNWWADALRGIWAFVEAYSGLYCGWEIIMTPGEYQVGSGYLRNFV